MFYQRYLNDNQKEKVNISHHGVFNRISVSNIIFKDDYAIITVEWKIDDGALYLSRQGMINDEYSFIVSGLAYVGEGLNEIYFKNLKDPL